MEKLTADDLYSLEEYHKARNQFRAEVLVHKRLRQVELGAHITLTFEDRFTIQYQVQEMLRIERIFETEALEEELGAYNPLIPDGRNLKATMLIEYTDVAQRREALTKLVGIEDRVYVRVAGHEPVFAVADEDLDRENEEKTSAVHFLRFEFSPEMCAALKSGSALAVGVDHENYAASVDPLPNEIRDALVADLD